MELVERANLGLHHHIIEKIEHVFPNKEISILDLGCGTGAFLQRLKSHGYQILNGIDIVKPDVEIHGVSIYEYDLDNNQSIFENNSLDLIVSIEVFEHIENLGSILQEISRILKPDGSLLITTPNVHSLEARLRFLFTSKLKQFDEKSDPTHISPIFLFPFRRLLKRYDLEITEIWGYPIDGFSPTTRKELRWLSKAFSFFGLKSYPSGDHLCLRIQKSKLTESGVTKNKIELVTSHY